MTTSEFRTNTRPSVAGNLVQANDFAAAQPTSLAEAVHAAARSVAEGALKPVAPHAARPAFDPKILLALLSYCYAREVYSSAEVEAELRRDVNFCQLNPGEFPDARIIRRFRRDNREALQLCLQAALRFLAEQKRAEGVVTKVNEARALEEARRRIIMAMFIDSLQQDRDQASDTPVDFCYLFAKGRPQVQ